MLCNLDCQGKKKTHKNHKNNNVLENTFYKREPIPGVRCMSGLVWKIIQKRFPCLYYIRLLLSFAPSTTPARTLAPSSKMFQLGGFLCPDQVFLLDLFPQDFQASAEETCISHYIGLQHAQVKTTTTGKWSEKISISTSFQECEYIQYMKQNFSFEKRDVQVKLSIRRAWRTSALEVHGHLLCHTVQPTSRPAKPLI